MSQIVPGGDSAASVIGLVIQEIDAQKRSVFTWRGWDHFQITDATHENLTAATIDYVHGNAIEPDFDGNLLVSSRHMDEITKIDRSTGEIIWRMGGKNNQFTFANDSLGFSHQHAIRRLPNGNISLYDNGNFHNTPFSRAVEYQLDEQTKKATLVWEYRNNPATYGMAMGYVQRLDNGNTLIGWGSTNPSVTEIAPDRTNLFELTLAPGMYSYRAFRFPWKEQDSGAPSDGPTGYDLSQNFPNPWNPIVKPQTHIQVSLPEDAIVSFKVYDVLGRLINVQLDGEPKTKGNYLLTLDGNSLHLPSGVYFYRLQTQRLVRTKKMQIVR